MLDPTPITKSDPGAITDPITKLGTTASSWASSPARNVATRSIFSRVEFAPSTLRHSSAKLRKLVILKNGVDLPSTIDTDYVAQYSRSSLNGAGSQSGHGYCA